MARHDRYHITRPDTRLNRDALKRYAKCIPGSNPFAKRQLKRLSAFRIGLCRPVFFVACFDDLSPVYQLLSTQPATQTIITILWSWTVQLRGKARLIKVQLSAIRRRFPWASICLTANSQAEKQELSRVGVESLEFSKNALHDYNLFRPLENGKTYDSILVARMAKWKRHTLAAKIPKLAIATHAPRESEHEHFRNMQSSLSHAQWLNCRHGEWSIKLGADDLSQAISSSHTGLCLSAREGQCRAAIEYLLTGTPVVSTPSLGGRDAFFNASNSIIAKPEPSAIYEAVRDLRQRKPSASEIRAQAISKIECYRSSLREHLATLGLPDQTVALAKRDWHAVFPHKLSPNFRF